MDGSRVRMRRRIFSQPLGGDCIRPNVAEDEVDFTSAGNCPRLYPKEI
jgi:hypothetical protein